MCFASSRAYIRECKSCAVASTLPEAAVTRRSSSSVEPKPCDARVTCTISCASAWMNDPKSALSVDAAFQRCVTLGAVPSLGLDKVVRIPDHLDDLGEHLHRLEPLGAVLCLLGGLLRLCDVLDRSEHRRQIALVGLKMCGTRRDPPVQLDLGVVAELIARLPELGERPAPFGCGGRIPGTPSLARSM